MRRAVLIAGPTASGKSALALETARERGGVIINADAMQVYRELRILTARPAAKDEEQAPHRLYGHVPAAESYSTGRWLADAGRELEVAWAASQTPIVAGGTGLYFRALEQGLADIPPVAAAIRQRWREALLSKGASHLHGVLKKINQAEAQRLKPGDGQRIVRALEVLEATGKPLSTWQSEAQQAAALAGVEVERIFLDVPRETLHARAESRFDGMIREGALDEVARLLALGLDPSVPAMKAIGVPELAAHLHGEITLENAITAAKTATRHYIKRQLTWWRGQGKHWPSGPLPPRASLFTHRG